MTWAALASGIAATVYGAIANAAHLKSGWQHDGWLAVAIAIASVLAIGAIARFSAWPWRRVTLVVLAALAASASGVAATATATLVTLSALQVGWLLTASSARTSARAWPIATAVGLAFLAALLQFTGRLPVHYPIAHLFVLLLPFAAMPTRVLKHWIALWKSTSRVGRPIPAAATALWALACIGLALRFIAAVAPEVGMDALGMHLTMPGIVARDHEWAPLASRFVWAWMPMAADWLFALAYPLGGEGAARLLNWGGDALVMLLCATLARRWSGRRGSSALSAALYSTAPLAYLLTSTLFVENLWTLWWTAAIVLMGQLQRRGQPTVGHYLALGLLIGIALATKVMTAFWAPIVLVFVALAWRNRAIDVRRLVAVAAPAMVIGFWPYAAAWVDTGNPVFPFMNAMFKSPLYPPHEPFSTPFVEGVHLDTLYALTFHTDRYLEAQPGGFGFAWLALLPAGLLAAILRGRAWIASLAIASLLFASACFAFTAYVRYIAPVMPVWAALIAAGLLSRPSATMRAVVHSVAGITCVLGLLFFANATWWYRAPPVSGLLGQEGYREWLSNMRPESVIVDRVNDLGLRHVLWVGRGYYPGLRAAVTTTGWHQNSGWSDLRDRKQLDAWIARQGIDGVVLGPGVNACDSLLCSAVASLGEPDTISNGVRLFRVQRGTLIGLAVRSERTAFAIEHLRDPELNGVGTAWSGTGEWDKARGIMRVDATHSFSQGVRVAGGQRYRYIIKARCAGAVGRYRAQVNWLRADGSLVQPLIETPVCQPMWKTTILDTVAPADAELAIIYGIGHDPGVSVEVDSMSLRE